VKPVIEGLHPDIFLTLLRRLNSDSGPFDQKAFEVEVIEVNLSASNFLRHRFRVAAEVGFCRM